MQVGIRRETVFRVDKFVPGIPFKVLKLFLPWARDDDATGTEVQCMRNLVSHKVLPEWNCVWYIHIFAKGLTYRYIVYIYEDIVRLVDGPDYTALRV